MTTGEDRRIEALRALSDAATPGEWSAHRTTATVARIDRDEDGRRRITFLVEALGCRSPEAGVDPAANAEFIAAAVNLVRDLLGERP